jgi:AraC-like DNA-binding protein
VYRSFPVAVVPERERFGYFQSVVDDVFCPMRVEPTGSSRNAFRGTVEAADLGRVRLARVATSPCSVYRGRGHVARLGDAPYLVKFQLRGESLWSQFGREVHLRPGDFVIASMSEPYRLQLFDDFEMPVLALAPRTMRELTPNPDEFLGLRMSGEDADCGLLSSFVAQVVSRMNRLPEPMVSRVEANILDLLGGVLGARTSASAATAGQQLAQMKAFIAEHLADRGLGPAMLAAAFRVSIRRVHALFAPDGVSVGRLVRRLRVHAAQRLLERQRHRSLTDIALDCGFYDLSHLSRCFREELGQSPREYRELCRAMPATDRDDA